MSARPHRSTPLLARKRSARSAIRRTATTLLLLTAGIGANATTATAAPTTSMVNLGTASSYAVLSGASVGNTVSAPGAPHTTLRGDLGVAVPADPTGFPPGVVTGATNIGNAAAVQAHLDVVAAYTEIAARTGGEALPLDLVGRTVTPGLYRIPGAAANTGTFTLDALGNPNAVFVIQVNGALAFAALSHVTLTNGARPDRVFWQVNGAGAIGALGSFAGTMIAMDAVAIGNGTLFNGRAFARNGALTMDAAEVYSAPPVVTIAGGATAYTTTMSPTISGTADAAAPTLAVTVNGQPLTVVRSAGTWSGTTPLIANGVYVVAATLTDGAGNVGSASQELTVDTVLPVVTIDGGATVATNDSTPTISGITDVPAGTLVHVDIGAQSRTAVVHAGGAWNVSPAALSDGTYTVAVAVSDAAGNQGVATQQLSVDTTAPTVTITGGPTALSNDPTPLLAGTATVVAGTTVTVDLADETLTAIVGADGSWSATAATLADGPHRIVVTTADAAGNSVTVTQWLTIDTVAPAMTITGGAAATTAALTPTITGTSTAAAGTTVTVTIAGQTWTTLVQGNGTWNATPTLVGLGTWPVVASAADPAGNVGSASQTLVIATTPLLPFISIDGGAAAATNDRTPTISGVTDVPAGTRVDVQIDDQVVQNLTAFVHAGGTWNVTVSAASPLSEGTFTVAAAITDTGGNLGVATQQLTVDTTAPALTITGGATALSNDPTPLLAGTAAVADGTTVTIDVANETLTAVVAGGAWSATAATLTDGVHRIVMTTTDAAGNVATATQSLTIDTVAPAMTITGGALASTATLTPTIAGTSTAAAGSTVTVTIGAQATTTLVQGNGSWSAPRTLVGSGPWQVVASATDPAGNLGTATQSLMSATNPLLPLISVDGGPTVATNDPTPTISGVTDVPAGTLVEVDVDGQIIPAVVHAGGAWNVAPSALADGTFTVSVSVTDTLGNVGVATQQLTVDTTAPAATITGGATALTNDPTPRLAGTAVVAAGTIVTIDVANETLTAVAGVNGSWSATAATLADGAHRIVITTADAAGNSVSVTQWLTVDTTAPAMTIAGGAAATTAALTPTITGTSSAVAGTTVTVTIAGQTRTVLVQGAGTWSVTPTLVGLGKWPVVVSAADLAGNVGTATQTLTIAALSPTGTAKPIAPARSTLSLKANSTKVKTGKLVILRGVLRSVALPARRTVRVTLRQKVGKRWVARRSVSVRTNATGAFAFSYRVPAGRRGAWRAQAVFAGVVGQRSATSPFAAFTAR